MSENFTNTMKISIEENNFPLGSEISFKDLSLKYILILLPLFSLIYLLNFEYKKDFSNFTFYDLSYYLEPAIVIIFDLLIVYKLFTKWSLVLNGDHIIVKANLFFWKRKQRINIKDLTEIYFETYSKKFKKDIIFKTEYQDYYIPLLVSQKRILNYVEKLNMVILKRKYEAPKFRISFDLTEH